MKPSPNDLEIALSQFTGTQRYCRLLPTFVVTDGVKYLMDQADCYWLAQLYGLHLIDIDFNDNAFTLLNLVRKGKGAKVTIEDGNGTVLSWQVIDWTDFPLDKVTLFGSWAGEFWVAMFVDAYRKLTSWGCAV